jgi:carbamoyl-phosphate synthase large subunit
MSDKLTMAAALSGKGIAVPATRSMADGPGRMTFPLVAKPRQGRGSRDVVLLRDPESAEGVIARMGERSRTMVLQEWIDGAEYTVQMLADSQGRLHAIAPVKVLQKRGVTIRGETDLEPRVISACRVIHEVIPAAGCYNVQLKLTADGHALPFEINPRISTTFCLTVAAGLDPISIFLRTVAPSTVASCKSGVVLHRHWKNHFSFSDNS